MSTPVNRIEIAKRYLDELRQTRPDIVGAWIGGSASRGEDTESSDIDLLILVSGDQPNSGRQSVDTWREGVYIDCLLFPITIIGTPEQTLQNAFTATHIYHARILIDTTGKLTELQNAVRAVYMQPKWLSLRLNFWLDIARAQLQLMQQATNEGDTLALSHHAGHAMSAFISVPLLFAGLSPSSSRGLLQVATVNMQLHDLIAEFEGSSRMQSQDVLALLPLFREWIPMADTNQRGDAPEYVVKKAEWMVQKGHPQAALHALWIFVHHMGGDCMGHAEKVVAAAEVARRWLLETGWDNIVTIRQKIALAHTILAELDALASDVNADP